MTVEETNFFKMVDGYSRAHHHCFLAEMNLSEARYSLCFRPTEVSKNSVNRYACLYLRIGADEVRAAVETPELPAQIVEMLDRELPALPGCQ